MALTYLYAIRLPVNDYAIAYVGVTKHPRTRVSSHVHGRTAIGKAIRACGRETVIFDILDRGSRDDMYTREIEMIVFLQTRWPNGYNLASGGISGRYPLPSTRAKLAAAFRGKKHSFETRARMSLASCSERNAFYGKVHSQETRAKMSASHRGRKHSAASLLKMSIARSGKGNPWFGKFGTIHPRYGIHHSAETKAKISLAKRGKYHSAETRALWSIQRRGAGNPNYGNRGERNPLYGKPRSAEIRAKISAAHRARHIDKMAALI